jgi:(p)ppGpp synthase/HD superfamily hydrolase
VSDQWIIKCFALADEAHGFKCEEHPDGQKRKWNNQPYIVHPFRVASRTMCLPGVPWEVVCAAALHDYFEDCQSFIKQFPHIELPVRVSSFIDDLTNTSKILYPEKNRAERKKIDRLRIHKIPAWAKAIKLIDRIDNLRDMGYCQDGFKWKYIEETELLLPYLVSQPYERKTDLTKGTLRDINCDEEPFKTLIIEPLANELLGVIADMRERLENREVLTTH